MCEEFLLRRNQRDTVLSACASSGPVKRDLWQCNVITPLSRWHWPFLLLMTSTMDGGKKPTRSVPLCVSWMWPFQRPSTCCSNTCRGRDGSTRAPGPRCPPQQSPHTDEQGANGRFWSLGISPWWHHQLGCWGPSGHGGSSNPSELGPAGRRSRLSRTRPVSQETLDFLLQLFSSINVYKIRHS